MKSNAIQLVAVYALFARHESLFAHDVHGLTGNHWHATDAWGFAALALAVMAAIWLSKGGK